MHARNQRLKKLGGNENPTASAAGVVQPEKAEPANVPMSQGSNASSKMDVDYRGTAKESTFPKSQPLGDAGDVKMSQTTGNMAGAAKAAARPQNLKTEEDLIHMLLSDVYHITNESQAGQPTRYGAQPKTFLYEFCQGG